MSDAAVHEHEFPTEPPRGSLARPGACECGQLWDPTTRPVIPPADERSGVLPVFTVGPHASRAGDTVRISLAHPGDKSFVPAALAVLRLDAPAAKDLLYTLNLYAKPIIEAWEAEQAAKPVEYDTEELAWFAENYADDEWMVHVTGMDDCHVRVNPDLSDDDPANPLFDEESAAKFAASFATFNTKYAERFPAEGNPGIRATVFRFGVPFTAETATGEN